MSGIPEKLYFLPEEVGSEDYKKPFNPADVREAEYEVHSADTDHSDDEDDDEKNETVTVTISTTHFKLSELIP